MSVELRRLHAMAETCLDLATHTKVLMARDFILDVADHLLAGAAMIDAESAPLMEATAPHLPGRDGAALSEPEKA